MRYTYVLTLGESVHPNQRLSNVTVTQLPVYATMQNTFGLTLYRYSLTFISRYSDADSRILIGTRVSKDLSENSYGLMYVSDISVVETPIIESLKTDWKPTDFYNFEDLNRVEEATLFVREKIGLFRGEIVPLDEIFTGRTEKTIEDASSLNRIETNLERLKLTFPDPSIFDLSKTNWTHDKPFDFSDATRYERMLYDMYYNIENNISNIPYCGQVVAGEEGVI